MKIKSVKEYSEEITIIKNDIGPDQDIIFRGQSDHSCSVESSLERYGVEKIKCDEYYRLIDRYKPLINPLIENRFERKTTMAGYPFNFKEYDKGSWELPDMEYLTYLRHHGFPTPLVDFTSSYYIALFFACEDFYQRKKDDGKVFIYYYPQIQIGGDHFPDLRKIGRYVEAGKRHFAQQSQYLIPSEYDAEWYFIPFSKALDYKSNAHELQEIIISKDAKATLMKELNEMNINRYTMYLNEDSLIKSFADSWALEKA